MAASQCFSEHLRQSAKSADSISVFGVIRSRDPSGKMPSGAGEDAPPYPNSHSDRVTRPAGDTRLGSTSPHRRASRRWSGTEGCLEPSEPISPSAFDRADKTSASMEIASHWMEMIFARAAVLLAGTNRPSARASRAIPARGTPCGWRLAISADDIVVSSPAKRRSASVKRWSAPTKKMVGPGERTVLAAEKAIPTGEWEIDFVMRQIGGERTRSRRCGNHRATGERESRDG